MSKKRIQFSTGYSIAAQARKLVHIKITLLHFVAFFHVASLLSTGVDNEKVGVDHEKALELTNSTVFHRGRQ